MSIPLSVILQVHDAELNLSETVEDLLDLISEWTREFEILIIDDGSIDETTTISSELSRLYPQVRTLRMEEPQGIHYATQIGMKQTTGEIVIVVDSRDAFSPAEMTDLWRMRHDTQLVMVRSPDFPIVDNFQRNGLRLLRRRAIERLAECPDVEKYSNVQFTHRGHSSYVGENTRSPKFLVRIKTDRYRALDRVFRDCEA